MVKRQKSEIGAKVHPDNPFFDIIEDAYRLLAFPKPNATETCECCMSPEIYRNFYNPPIRELPYHYVREWYFAAHQPPKVTKATWAYLLPRILEILASGNPVSEISIEISLSRFDTGNPSNWTAEQWAVIDRFQRCYLQRTINYSRADKTQQVMLDDVACMFRLAGWSLDSLIEQIHATEDHILAQRLWLDWCNYGREMIWTTAFWSETDRAAMFEFYSSPGLYNRMEALAMGADTSPNIASKAFAVACAIESSNN